MNVPSVCACMCVWVLSCAWPQKEPHYKITIVGALNACFNFYHSLGMDTVVSWRRGSIWLCIQIRYVWLWVSASIHCVITSQQMGFFNKDSKRYFKCRPCSLYSVSYISPNSFPTWWERENYVRLCIQYMYIYDVCHCESPHYLVTDRVDIKVHIVSKNTPL